MIFSENRYALFRIMLYLAAYLHADARGGN